MAANPQSALGRRRLYLMPPCTDPTCPRVGRQTCWISTSHLTITKGGNGPIDIDLAECRASRNRGSPAGHYIHFGPDGQVATPLPRVKGKKGLYWLIVNGQRVETEWVASSETRKALGEASRKGWKPKKKRKQRIRKLRRTFAKPAQKRRKTEIANAVWAKRRAAEAELKELRAKNSTAKTRTIGRPPNEELGRRVRELRATIPKPSSWARVKLTMDRETGEERALSTYRWYARNS